MLYLLLKYGVTAAVVVVVSELAKRSDRLGAFVASLPLVTVLALIWLYVEDQPSVKLANHAWYTFWYVLPTLPMFLTFPWLIHRYPFWISLGISAGLTVGTFAIYAVVLRRFGISLI